MSRKQIWIASWLALWLGLAPTCPTAQAEPADKDAPPIYDTAADGQKQIAAALRDAQKAGQRVLVVFGANWCGWCHKLHKLFADDKDVAAALKAGYVVVWIDVDQVDGQPHNAALVELYGKPTQFGLPAIVVLDSLGMQLATEDTNKLEDGKQHDPRKVLAMLEKWKPHKQAARSSERGARNK